MLQVACHSADPDVHRTWPLDFDLRAHGEDQADPPASAPAALTAEPNATAQAMDEARKRVLSQFSQPADGRNKLTAARVTQVLEKILGMPKAEWNWVVVRSLWEALAASAGQRRQSVDHEEAWLILAGFLLRPGFGAGGDEARMDTLWNTREAGFSPVSGSSCRSTSSGGGWREGCPASASNWCSPMNWASSGERRRRRPNSSSWRDHWSGWTMS